MGKELSRLAVLGIGNIFVAASAHGLRRHRVLIRNEIEWEAETIKEHGDYSPLLQEAFAEDIFRNLANSMSMSMPTPTPAPVDKPTKRPVDEPTPAAADTPANPPFDERTPEHLDEPSKPPVNKPTPAPAEKPAKEEAKPTPAPVEKQTPAPVAEPSKQLVDGFPPSRRPTLAPNVDPTEKPVEPANEQATEFQPATTYYPTPEPTPKFEPSPAPDVDSNQNPAQAPLHNSTPSPVSAATEACAAAGESAQECGAVNLDRPKLCCDGFSCPPTAASLRCIPSPTPTAPSVPSLAPVTAPIPAPVDVSNLRCNLSEEERRNQIYIQLGTLSDPLDINVPGTPQEFAYNWIVSEDRYLCPDDETLIQRYVLTLLYSSTDGDGWEECSSDDSACGIGATKYPGANAFLSSDSECTWAGILCNLVGEVTGINLQDNSLGGSIPSELSALVVADEILLQENGIRGTVPASICDNGALTRLETDCGGEEPLVVCECCTRCHRN